MSGISKNRVCIIALFAVMFVVLTLACTVSADSDADIVPQDTSPVKSIAHRGYSDVAPENTLPSYQLAYEMGFKYVETDIAVTSDGKYVLLHDSSIDRTSNGTGEISEMTLAEARTYDFGSWKSPEYAGTQIPTLEEFLDLCSTYNLCPYIEFKMGTVTPQQIREIVDIVDSYNMLPNTSFISFSSEYLGVVKDYCSTVRLGYVALLYFPSDIDTLEGLKTSENEVFFDLSMSFSEACVDCKAAGIPVEVWADDSAEAMRNMDNYITGVTTNSLRYCDVCSVITMDLTGCKSSNGLTRADIGSQYSTTITSDKGYIPDTVTCTMGGVAQPVHNGVIDITKVTGDITITASSDNSRTIAGSELLNGYDSDCTGLLPDQTSTRSEIGGNYYYSVVNNGEATIYPAFDIVLVPNSVYEFKIDTALIAGTDYSYSLQFFNSSTVTAINKAYSSSAPSISNFTACSYDTSWFTSSDTLIITTGSADDNGDFTVTLSPASPVQQKYNVCGFRFLISNATGTAAVDPSDFSFTLSKTSCSVSFVSNGGTSVPMQTVAVGTNAVKPADPTRFGYTFGGWYSDEGLTSAYDFDSAVRCDTVLYAKWIPIEYTIKYVSRGGISIDDTKYTIEDNVILSTPSREGYDFVGWYDNEKFSGDRIKELPVGSTGDRTYYAKWNECPADNAALILGIIVAVIAVECIGIFAIIRICSKP